MFKHRLANARLLIALALLAVFFQSTLKMIGFNKSYHFAKWLANTFGASSEQAKKDNQQTTRTIVRYSRLSRRVSDCQFAYGKCLANCLSLYFLLTRKNISPQLVFGQKVSDTNQLMAHAWLEFDGVVINDNCDVIKTYQRFKEF